MMLWIQFKSIRQSWKADFTHWGIYLFICFSGVITENARKMRNTFWQFYQTVNPVISNKQHLRHHLPTELEKNIEHSLQDPSAVDWLEQKKMFLRKDMALINLNIRVDWVWFLRFYESATTGGRDWLRLNLAFLKKISYTRFQDLKKQPVT